MKKTKILSIIVVMATMLALVIALGISASAADSALPFIDTGDCADTYAYATQKTTNLKWTFYYDGTDGILTIEPKSAGVSEALPDYFNHGSFTPWYDNCTLGHRITLQNDNRWKYCQLVTKLVIKDGVTGIGTGSFYYLIKLKEVVIEGEMTHINSTAFMDCWELETVDLRNTDITSIGEQAFYNCKKLTTVYLPETLTSLGANAFSSTPLTGGGNVSNVADSKNGVYYVDGWAVGIASSGHASTFEFRHGVEGKKDTVGVADGVLAGYNCTTIKIPESVRYIGNYALAAQNATTIEANANNPYFYSDNNGVLFSKDKKTIVAYPRGKTETYTIPSSVETIGRYAFYGSKITGVTIPASVTVIECGAFEFSESLSAVTIPSGVTRIEMGTFIACYALESIVIPKNVKSVGASAFSSSGIKKITFCRADIELDDSGIFGGSRNSYAIQRELCWPNATSDNTSNVAQYYGKYNAYQKEYLKKSDYVPAPTPTVEIDTISANGCQIDLNVPGEEIASIKVTYTDKDGQHEKTYTAQQLPVKLDAGHLYKIEITVNGNSKPYTVYVNLNFVNAFVHTDNTELRVLKTSAKTALDWDLEKAEFKAFLSDTEAQSMTLNSPFTTITKDKLQNAYDTADALLSNAGATQIDVDNAFRALNKAYREYVSSIRVNIINCADGYTNDEFCDGKLVVSVLDNPKTASANVTINGISFSFTQTIGEKPTPTGGGTTGGDDGDKTYTCDAKVIGNSAFVEITGNYKSAKVGDVDVSGGIFIAPSAGEYTVTFNWEGKTETKKVTVSTGFGTLSGDNISLSIPETVDVKNLYYTGSSDISDGRSYLTLGEKAINAKYLGATTHTFRVVYTYKGATDICYATVDCTSATAAPVVVCYGGAVGIFYYGANVEWVAYASGANLDAEDVRAAIDVTYTAVNSTVSKVDFTPGAWYTFCFKTSSGTTLVEFQCPGN